MVSVRWVAPVLLLAAMTLPALAQEEQPPRPKHTNTPPKTLHKIGDHWTAYYPPDPATYPANARTHTIVPGDTLWGLAQTFYGNGYLWPQLWESNTWITDAHWIYPGDVLLVEGEVSQAAVGTETTATTGTGAEGTAGQQQMGIGPITASEVRREAPPIALGAEADVYCYGYIGHPDEPMPNWLSGFEDVEILYQPGTIVQGQEMGATKGDLIFVTGGTSSGLVAGETYMAVVPADLILHPRTRELIGRHYDYIGQIRILCASETQSRAIITESCREMKIGTRLKPMPQLPIPIARIPDPPEFCDSPTGRSPGFIVDSQDWDFALAEGNLVQINLGRDDSVQPGDFFTVYRDSPIAGQPRQVLGEIGILTTESHTATGRIVAMRRTMQIGDYVEAR